MEFVFQLAQNLLWRDLNVGINVFYSRYKAFKELISQGERKTLEELNYCEYVNYDFNR